MKYITWKTGIHSVTVNGITWQCWTRWDLAFRFCGFGFVSDWYDGPHDIWSFGICSLHRSGDCNYREAHELAEQKAKESL